MFSTGESVTMKRAGDELDLRPPSRARSQTPGGRYSWSMVKVPARPVLTPQGFRNAARNYGVNMGPGSLYAHQPYVKSWLNTLQVPLGITVDGDFALPPQEDLFYVGHAATTIAPVDSDGERYDALHSAKIVFNGGFKGVRNLVLGHDRQYPTQPNVVGEVDIKCALRFVSVAAEVYAELLKPKEYFVGKYADDARLLGQVEHWFALAALDVVSMREEEIANSEATREAIKKKWCMQSTGTATSERIDIPELDCQYCDLIVSFVNAHRQDGVFCRLVDEDFEPYVLQQSEYKGDLQRSFKSIALYIEDKNTAQAAHVLKSVCGQSLAVLTSLEVLVESTEIESVSPCGNDGHYVTICPRNMYESDLDELESDIVDAVNAACSSVLSRWPVPIIEPCGKITYGRELDSGLVLSETLPVFAWKQSHIKLGGNEYQCKYHFKQQHAFQAEIEEDNGEMVAEDSEAEDDVDGDGNSDAVASDGESDHFQDEDIPMTADADDDDDDPVLYSQAVEIDSDVLIGMPGVTLHDPVLLEAIAAETYDYVWKIIKELPPKIRRSVFVNHIPDIVGETFKWAMAMRQQVSETSVQYYPWKTVISHKARIATGGAASFPALLMQTPTCVHSLQLATSVCGANRSDDGTPEMTGKLFTTEDWVTAIWHIISPRMDITGEYPEEKLPFIPVSTWKNEVYRGVFATTDGRIRPHPKYPIRQAQEIAKYALGIGTRVASYATFHPSNTQPEYGRFFVNSLEAETNPHSAVVYTEQVKGVVHMYDPTTKGQRLSAQDTGFLGKQEELFDQIVSDLEEVPVLDTTPDTAVTNLRRLFRIQARYGPGIIHLLGTHAFNILFKGTGIPICPLTTPEGIDSWPDDAILYVASFFLLMYHLCCPAGCGPVQQSFAAHLRGPGGGGKSTIVSAFSMILNFMMSPDDTSDGTFSFDFLYDVLKDSTVNRISKMPTCLMTTDKGSKPTLDKAIIVSILGTTTDADGKNIITCNQKFCPRITAPCPTMNVLFQSNVKGNDHNWSGGQLTDDALRRRCVEAILPFSREGKGNEFTIVGNSVNPLDSVADGSIQECPFKGFTDPDGNSESLDESIKRPSALVVTHGLLALVAGINKALQFKLPDLWQETVLCQRMQETTAAAGAYTSDDIQAVLKFMHERIEFEGSFDSTTEISITPKNTIKCGVSWGWHKAGIAQMIHDFQEHAIGAQKPGLKTLADESLFDAHLYAKTRRFRCACGLTIANARTRFIVDNIDTITTKIYSKGLVCPISGNTHDFRRVFCRSLRIPGSG